MRIGCIICCESYEDDAEISAVKCGHTFHQKCLNQWVNQSKTCPQCRQPVRVNEIIKKLYFDHQDSEGNTDTNPDDAIAKLKNDLNSVQTSLVTKDRDLKTIRAQVIDLTQKNETFKQSLKDEIVISKTLRTQLLYFQEQQKYVDVAKKEAKQAREAMKQLADVKKIITGCEADVQELLNENCASGSPAMKQMCTYIVTLKRELNNCKEERENLKSTHKNDIMKLLSIRQKLKDSENKNSELEQRMKFYLMKSTPTPRTPLSKTASSTVGASLKMDDSVICLDDTPKSLRATKSAPKMVVRLDDNGDFLKPSDEKVQNPAPKKRPRVEDDDVSLPEIYSYNILKPHKSNMYDSKKRVAYDGLGGHSSFIQKSSGVAFSGAKPKAKVKSGVTLKKNQKTLTSLFNMKLS